MKHLAIAVLVGVLAFAGPASAQQAHLPAELKLPLLVKVLSFDRDLEKRSRDVVVAVVFQRNVPASLRERDEWFAAAGARPSLNGARVRVVGIEYRDADELVVALNRAGARIVFLPQLRAVDMPALADRLRAAGFRTATDEPALAGRSASVGLLLRAGRPHVVINMPLAVREGSDYSSQLLRVVEVVQ